jgi:glycosyltransferase involved in cell wall biosynthesis
MNKFTILVVGANCERFIRPCLLSCIYQNFDEDKFNVIFSDDFSTDETFTIAKELEKNHKNFKAYQTPKKIYKNLNIKTALEQYIEPGRIIVLVDADDWLAHTGVLNILDRVYTSDVWMTYGLYEEYPYKDVSSFYSSYSEETIKANSFRKDRWLASHLGTFRRELYLKINEGDLKDIDGEYFRFTGDMAMMFPMLEMSGSRSKFINEVIYIYNRTNALSDDKIGQQEQGRIEQLLRNKTPYKPLNEL